jgi:hypothetical protein
MKNSERHRIELNKLDSDLKNSAVEYLKQNLQNKNYIAAAIKHDPEEWWVTYHFFWGMGVRNLLREGGFTDDVMGGNLDDFYVGLVEEALINVE